MSDRGSRSPKERASNERGTKVPKQPESKQRRVSRAEREAKRQKQIRFAVGLAAVAVLAVVIGFATWDYVIKPRQVLATVDGSRIRREDYWKYRKYELYQQMSQYSQYSQLVSDQQQAQQYQSLALQAQAQMNNVWGSTNVNDATLQQMIDNQIYVQSLDEFNLTITDEELELWTLNQFAPPEQPLIEPTVTPTFVPERAEWATQTAEALMPVEDVSPTASIGDSTPVGGATPIAETDDAELASPIASPDADIAESASPVASPIPIASPEIGGATPIAEASPVVTMEPTPTMSADQAIATAEAGWTQYQSVLNQANMSVDDYYRLAARPQLAQQMIRAEITAGLGQTADQVHARHILVATEELANQLYNDISSGAQDFAAAAAQSSTDTSTAPNGGDLGWFSRGVMVPEFEEVAFTTPVGQVAPPVQSGFGWHIIEVLEAQANRALTDDQLSQLQQSEMQNWLTERQQQLSISSVMAPTPTPANSNFVPPIDAPPVSMETAVPEPTFLPATPEASPIASPVIDASTAVASPELQIEASPESPAGVAESETPAASPIVAVTATPGATTAAVVSAATPAPDAPASPESPLVATPDWCLEASPIASPIASPGALPEGSPVASPYASPMVCAAP